MYNKTSYNRMRGKILLKGIHNFIQKYGQSIVTVTMILLIFSIGFGKATVLKSVIIFLLVLLLAFMPDKFFDDEDSDEKR